MAVKEKILNLLKSTIGKTFPDTYNKYEEMFSHVSDLDIKDYFLKRNGMIRLYVDDDKVKQKDVDQLVRDTGVVLEEKLLLPYKENTVTKNKIMVFPMQILKLQQMATKENGSTISTNQRDMNNQTTRGSKTGLLSDDEVAAMAAYGSVVDPIVKELFSPRGDNRITKKYMNEAIRDNLEFSLADMPNGSMGRITLLHLDANYACMGLATDLIDHIDERS